MIKSLTLKNYKSWKNQTFDFSPGVNVIKGTSHMGKSNIHRAIVWALQNSPNRDEFGSIHEPENKKTSVKILFDDEQSIERGRKGGTNYYKVNKDELKAFRFDVPDKVFGVAMMDERNAIDQHTKFTLISDSPGEAGRIINQISGLSEADKLLKSANKCLSNHSDKLKDVERQISENKRTLSKYEFVPDLVAMVQRISDVDQERIGVEQKVSALAAVIEQRKTARENLEQLDFLQSFEQDLSIVDQVQTDLEKIEGKSKKLSGLLNNRAKLADFLERSEGVDVHLDSLVETESKLLEVSKEHKELSSLLEDRRDCLAFINSTVNVDSNLTILEETAQELAEVRNSEAALAKLLEERKGCSDRLDSIRTNLKTKEGEIIDILGAMEFCPVCDQVIEI